MDTPEVTPEMNAAAREFLVDEAHDERAAAKRAAALEGDTAPTADAAEEKAAAEKAENEKQVVGALKMLGFVAWSVIDGAVVKYVGEPMKLTPDEKGTLADATVPVIDKYMPGFMQKLFDGPEGQLLIVAGAIYGAKAVTLMTAPAPAPQQPPAQQPSPPETSTS